MGIPSNSFNVLLKMLTASASCAAMNCARPGRAFLKIPASHVPNCESKDILISPFIKIVGQFVDSRTKPKPLGRLGLPTALIETVAVAAAPFLVLCVKNSGTLTAETLRSQRFTLRRGGFILRSKMPAMLSIGDPCRGPGELMPAHAIDRRPLPGSG